MADKTMTIGEYIKEAAVFKYSKDYFDMMKECGELELMATYLDSYEYMKENADLDIEVHESVTSMFMEAADSSDEKKEVSEDAVNEVKGNFGKRVLDAIVRILKIIATPFTALGRMIAPYADRMKTRFEKTAKYLKYTILDENADKKITEFAEKKPELYKEIMDHKASLNDTTRNWLKSLEGYKKLAPSQRKFFERLISFTSSEMLFVPATYDVLRDNLDNAVQQFGNLESTLLKQDGNGAKISNVFETLTKRLVDAREKGFIAINAGDVKSIVDKCNAASKSAIEARDKLNGQKKTLHWVTNSAINRVVKSLMEFHKTLTETVAVMSAEFKKHYAYAGDAIELANSCLSGANS